MEIQNTSTKELAQIARKVALVHWIAVWESDHGEHSFSIDQLWEAYKKDWSDREIEISLDEMKEIIHELGQWAFVSSSDEHTTLFALGLYRSPQEADVLIHQGVYRQGKIQEIR